MLCGREWNIFVFSVHNISKQQPSQERQGA